ncbi:hypothetical protein NDU88_006539 [Pleurodeles waltl]|uniref:Uncharacterized protein n=1 Tax=Pleurodeles waltl TaxID=8319 RepID=A0AAV7UQA7_PLEWA|nr:hypothetical protein NDU88_006539 [Pleurodeles waltl]
MEQLNRAAWDAAYLAAAPGREATSCRLDRIRCLARVLGAVRGRRASCSTNDLCSAGEGLRRPTGSEPRGIPAPRRGVPGA